MRGLFKKVGLRDGWIGIWVASGGRLRIFRMGSVVNGFNILLVVTGNVAWLFCSFQFESIFANDGLLDHIAARLVDWVSDIRIEFVGCSFDIAEVLSAVQSFATLIAVVAAHVVLRAALSAPRGHFATGHRDEGSVGALDDLKIANDERVIEGNRAKGAEPIL